MKTLLITGGAGYIGSHTCLNLLSNGNEIYILDSFVNSSPEVFEKIKLILKENNKFENVKLKIYKGSLKDEDLLNEIFSNASASGRPIEGVIHFASLKSVSESLLDPIKYWDENLVGTINLLKAMNKNNCKNIVFSSSATVYGIKPDGSALRESDQIKPTNPYGFTKSTIEIILLNLFSSCKEWKIINLRYFNPIGAHSSGLIGEKPLNNPENIFPNICQVAAGIKPKLYIYGKDWLTKDGTCERDFVHVLDVAEAHILSINYLYKASSQFLNINIGTGNPTSILELVKTFEKVNNLKINYEFVDRRPGDIYRSFADVGFAYEILNWKSSRNLKEMCVDGWKWQKNQM